jgi:hypothetical protein
MERTNGNNHHVLSRCDAGCCETKHDESETDIHDGVQKEILLNNKDPEFSLQLGDVNSKLIAEGEKLPLVRLKDGTRIQTGTVATMLHNIREYDKGSRGTIETELEMAIPTLFTLGMFDLFTPEEWLRGTSPGRRFVGEKAIVYRDTQRPLQTIEE